MRTYQYPNLPHRKSSPDCPHLWEIVEYTDQAGNVTNPQRCEFCWSARCDVVVGDSLRCTEHRGHASIWNPGHPFQDGSIWFDPALLEGTFKNEL